MHEAQRAPRNIFLLGSALAALLVCGCAASTGAAGPEEAAATPGMKVVCTREKPIGSNIKKEVCRPVDAVKKTEQASQEAIRDAQRSSGMGSGAD